MTTSPAFQATLRLEEMMIIKTQFLSMLDKPHDSYDISIYDAIKWLELDQNTKHDTKYIVRNIKLRILNDEKFNFSESKNGEYNYDYIIIKESRFRTPYFSSRGFKKFCLLQKTPKGHLVREYFIQIELDYMTALKNSKKENEQILYELKNRIRELHDKHDAHNNSLIIVNDELLQAHDANNSLQKENFYQSSELVRLERLETALTQEEFEGCNDIKIFQILQKRFMKPVKIYLVKSHDFDSINAINVVDYNQDLLFMVGPMNNKIIVNDKIKHIADVYMMNKQHYSEFLLKLEPTVSEQKVCKRKVYEITYAELLDYGKRALIDLDY
jgi:hypothetical protein